MKRIIHSPIRGEGDATTATDSDLLTIAEATRLLKVGRTTLHRWLRSGRLRAYQVGPKAVRIRRGDLQAVMKPIAGGEVTAVKETHPLPMQTTIRPLSDEEVRRGLAALKRSRELTARMLAERGGRPFDASWPLIREAREERSEQV